MIRKGVVKCPSCGYFNWVMTEDALRGVITPLTCKSCDCEFEWKNGEFYKGEESMSSKAVNHPSHYADGRKFEPIDVITDWDLNFNLGNTVKYISRAGRKDDIVQDLEKAKFYLDYEIERLKNGRSNDN